MLIFVQQSAEGGDYMGKSKLQEAAIQKSLELTEQEAFKVLIFIAGMEAQQAVETAGGQPRNPLVERSA